MINRLKAKREELVEDLIDLKEEVAAVEGKIALLDEIIEEEEEAAEDAKAEVVAQDAAAEVATIEEPIVNTYESVNL